MSDHHSSTSHTEGSACYCSCSCQNDATHDNQNTRMQYLPLLLSLLMLATGLLLDFWIRPAFFAGYVRLSWYILSYLPVSMPVLKSSWTLIRHKDFFNEFTLMAIATLGAFFIGEYPEAVAVMLFYSTGELFQDAAVNRARRNIKALLDLRPDKATVLRNGETTDVAPECVEPGEIIQVKAGEKVPLDGMLLSEKSSFNTAALTGESVPRTAYKGESVLAGMVNLDHVIQIRTEKAFADSSLARILDMVQNATSRKAKTELFIRKFAHIYTPIVFLLAALIVVVPALFTTDYNFNDWLYRVLVFLVISCPCALVISIPLSYFGGIGAASRKGILFKGANYLEMLTKINTVVFDKTGTLTRGVFKVREMVTANPAFPQLPAYAAALESFSNHPIAKAITEYAGAGPISELRIENVEEKPGYGITGEIDGHRVLAGNRKLMQLHQINYDKQLDNRAETTVILAVDQHYAGYILIADEVKEDAATAIKALKQAGITRTVMLSGDKATLVHEVASQLDIDEAHGDLLPEDKVQQIERLQSDPARRIAFVGDGINDAPVLALSDIGIAMGGMGSDAAIEVADVVIQTDQPSKIATAIAIAKATRRIVIANILLAIGVKVGIMTLGAFGIATLWEAVFADVGVSLLAILNAVSILKRKF